MYNLGYESEIEDEWSEEDENKFATPVNQHLR